MGKFIFPQAHPEREIATQVELLNRAVAERKGSGLGTQTAGLGLERVPQLLAAWQNLAPAPEPPLPPVPVIPLGSQENLTSLLAEWVTLPAGERGRQSVQLGKLWGSLDPLAGLAWAAQIPDAADQSAAHQGLAKGWAPAEPFAASEWLATLPAGPARTAIVSAYAQAAGPVAPRLALAFALTVEDAAVREEIIPSILSWAASACPTEAAGLIRAANLPAAELAADLATLTSAHP